MMSAEKSCKKSALSMFKESFQNSTIHSVPHIVRNRNYFLKILWFCCFFASSIGCVYSIYKSIKNYYEYDVVTTIKVENKNKIDFPMVKICNLNAINTDFARENLADVVVENGLKEWLDKFQNVKFDDAHTYLNQSQYLIEIQLLGFMAKYNSITFNKTLRNKLSNSIEFYLTGCLFSARPCSTLDDFEIEYDLQYGNCFRFNSGKNLNGLERKLMESSQTGIMNGLVMDLFIGSAETNKNAFSFLNGFTVYIVEQNADVMLTEGIYVPPGFSTNIIIDKKITKRAPYPYSDCTTDLTSIDSYDSELYRKMIEKNVTYTHSYCLRLCFQKEIERTCNCSDLNAISFYNYPRCMSYSDFTCYLKYYQEYASKNMFTTCKCPNECNKVSYSYTSSLSEFPTKSYAKTLMKNPKIIEKFPPNYEITYEDIRKSVASLTVFYNELKETTIVAEPKTNPFELTASVGGILGLFLGMSFMSLVEIVEVFLKIANLKRKHHKKEKEMAKNATKHILTVWD